MPAGAGYKFTRARREAAIKACADGMGLADCARVGGVCVDTLRIWLRLGESATCPEKTSVKRWRDGIEFVEAWKRAVVLGEEAQRQAAADRHAKRLAEIEEACDRALDVIIDTATRRQVSKKRVTVRKITTDKGTAVVTEEENDAPPSWHAASRLLEAYRSAEFARGHDRLAAQELARREALYSDKAVGQAIHLMPPSVIDEFLGAPKERQDAILRPYLERAAAGDCDRDGVEGEDESEP